MKTLRCFLMVGALLAVPVISAGTTTTLAAGEGNYSLVIGALTTVIYSTVDEPQGKLVLLDAVNATRITARYTWDPVNAGAERFSLRVFAYDCDERCGNQGLGVKRGGSPLEVSLTMPQPYTGGFQVSFQPDDPCGDDLEWCTTTPIALYFDQRFQYIVTQESG